MYLDYYNGYNQYYGVNTLNSEPQINNEEIITLNQAIALIKESVEDEKEDEMFYDAFIKQAPTQKEKDMITSIRNDEKKHVQILKGLYYELTGQKLLIENLRNQTKLSEDYKSNLEKALLGELEDVAKYRKIMGTMPSGNNYTLLMSIMTDELIHAHKCNFLMQSAT